MERVRVTVADAEALRVAEPDREGLEEVERECVIVADTEALGVAETDREGLG